jgi:hypothetical protein
LDRSPWIALLAPQRCDGTFTGVACHFIFKMSVGRECQRIRVRTAVPGAASWYVRSMMVSHQIAHVCRSHAYSATCRTAEEIRTLTLNRSMKVLTMRMWHEATQIITADATPLEVHHRHIILQFPSQVPFIHSLFLSHFHPLSCLYTT